MQQYQPDQAAINEIRRVLNVHLNNRVRMQQFSQDEATMAANEINTHIVEIAGMIVASAGRDAYQPIRVSEKMLMDKIGAIADQLVTQYRQRMQQQNNIGGGGFQVYNALQPAPIVQPSGWSLTPVADFTDSRAQTTIVTQQPAFTPGAPANQSTALPVNSFSKDLGETDSPVLTFTATEDLKATTMSYGCRDGEIVDVLNRVVLEDNNGEKYNYTRAVNYITEPSIGRVITNFIRTNPRLITGKYIVDLEYNQFVLKEVPARPSGAIDLSPLKAENRANVPVSFTIKQILKSINDRHANIVAGISEVVINEFNDMSKRYLRVASDISKTLTITALSDLEELADMRDDELGDLTFLPDYEEAVLNCFAAALEVVITDVTKIGCYTAEDIAPALLSSPKFVIREPGMTERGMDLRNPDFVKAINDHYTAFARWSSVVIMNFIPDDWEEGLRDFILKIERVTNPVDHLILGKWAGVGKTLVMNVGDKRLVAKTGTTLDGVNFVFADSLNDERYN